MLRFTRVLADQSYQQMPRARLCANGQDFACHSDRVYVVDGSQTYVEDPVFLYQVSLYRIWYDLFAHCFDFSESKVMKEKIWLF